MHQEKRVYIFSQRRQVDTDVHHVRRNYVGKGWYIYHTT